MTEFMLNNEQLIEFKTIINSVISLSSNIPFVVNSEGLTLRCMDAAHGAMVNMMMKKESFETFEYEEEINIPINGDNLRRILDRVNKNDTGLFKIDTTQNKLKILFEGINKREFSLPYLVGHEFNKLPAPDMVLSCLFKITPKLIEEIVSDIGLFSESVNIQLIKDKTLIFKDNNASYGSTITIDLEKENGSIINYDTEEDTIDVTYGIEYLRNTTKLDNIANAVTIEFGDAKPIRITYQINDETTVIFLISPYEEPKEY